MRYVIRTAWAGAVAGGEVLTTQASHLPGALLAGVLLVAGGLIYLVTCRLQAAPGEPLLVVLDLPDDLLLRLDEVLDRDGEPGQLGYQLRPAAAPEDQADDLDPVRRAHANAVQLVPPVQRYR